MDRPFFSSASVYISLLWGPKNGEEVLAVFLRGIVLMGLWIERVSMASVGFVVILELQELLFI